MPPAFTFTVPPVGELLPSIDRCSTEEAAAVLRWAVAAYLGKAVPSGSPLDRWLRVLDVAKLTPSEVMSPVLDGRLTRTDLYDVREAIRLAWSVAALHSDRTKAKISRSAVEDLLLPDNAQAPAARQMPNGASLLYQAARLLQAGGGEIEVLGRESKGRDLLWSPASGGRVGIERKDRAFAETFDTTNGPGFFKKYLVKASEGLPRDGAARVVSIGYATPTLKEAQQWSDTFSDRVRKFLDGSPPEAWPDAAYGSFVAYETVDGFEEARDLGKLVVMNYGGQQSPALVEVLPALMKAYATSRPAPVAPAVLG